MASILKDERLTPYHSDEYMLRMVRDLLDQQIIDAQGRKVVRVNDVTFLKECENGHDVLHILEVDIGLRSILRRVLRGDRFARDHPRAAEPNPAKLHSLGVLQHSGSRSAAPRPAEHLEQASGEHASGGSGRYRRKPRP